MTISRVPEDEPKRWKNGCLSLFLRLAVLFLLVCATIYAVLYYSDDFPY